MFANEDKRLFLCLIALVVVFYATGSSRAAFLAQTTEVLTASHDFVQGTLPAYIEILATPPSDSPTAIDLVIVNAAIGKYGRVQQVVTIQMKSGVDVYVVHEQGWPTETPANAARVETGSLDFGPPGGGARSLLLFDHQTGWSAGILPDEVWAEPGLLDQVAFRVGGWPTDAVDPLALSYGHAAARIYNGADYTDSFIAGFVDENLVFPTNQFLTPVLYNELQPIVPEPNSCAILIVTVFMTRVRCRRRHGCGARC